MNKLIAALLALVAFPALAQSTPPLESKQRLQVTQEFRPPALSNCNTTAVYKRLGDLCYDTFDNTLKMYTGSSFVTVATGVGSGNMTDPGANGIMVRTASNVSTARTLTGTTGQIAITNGSGVSGNLTIALDSTVDLRTKALFYTPVSTAATATQNGQIAYNSTSNTYIGGAHGVRKTFAYTSSDITGNAATATALAANGTNCSAGQAPLGVDASGNAEGCFTPSGGSPAGSTSEIQIKSGSSFGAYAGASCSNTFFRALSATGVATCNAILPADTDFTADNTTANSTTGHHGLLPKLGGGTTNFLRADGTWATPPGSGSVSISGTPVAQQVAFWASASALAGQAGFTWDGTQLATPDPGNGNRGITLYQNASPTHASAPAANYTTVEAYSDGSLYKINNGGSSTKIYDAGNFVRTDTASMTVDSPTTADDGKVQVQLPLASTITRVDCSTDAGTVTIQFYVRSEGSPNSGTTAVLASSLTCTTTSANSSSFTTSAISSRSLLVLSISATSGTPGVLRAHVEYTTP